MFQLKSQPSFYCVCNQPKTQGSKCWFLSFYLVCFMSFWTTCEVLKCFLTCFKVQNTNFETQLNLEIWYSYLHVDGGALCALDVLSFRWNYNPPSNCACNHLKTWVKILVFWDSMFIIRMCKLNFSLGNFWSSKPFCCKLQHSNVTFLWTNYALDIPTTLKGTTTHTYAYSKIMHTIDLTTTYCRQWPQWYAYYLFKNPHFVACLPMCKIPSNCQLKLV
jgi:hypothetical protein